MSLKLQKSAGRPVGRTEDCPWFQPTVNITESAEEFVLTANMPGVRADGIQVKFERGLLTLHGKVADRQPGGTRYLLREYAVGDYHRTFQISETIDSERISAEYSHGVLTLHLPKVARAKPRQIKIAVR